MMTSPIVVPMPKLDKKSSSDTTVKKPEPALIIQGCSGGVRVIINGTDINTTDIEAGLQHVQHSRADAKSNSCIPSVLIWLSLCIKIFLIFLITLPAGVPERALLPITFTLGWCSLLYGLLVTITAKVVAKGGAAGKLDFIHSFHVAIALGLIMLGAWIQQIWRPLQY